MRFSFENDSKVFSGLLLFLMVLLVVLTVLVYLKVKKNCNDKEKYVKNTPPLPGNETTKFPEYMVQDCRDFFNANCKEPEDKECCQCKGEYGMPGAGPYYVCLDDDDNPVFSSSLNLDSSDPLCGVGKPVAYNVEQCENPRVGGNLLCGGNMPQCDYGKSCSSRPNLPFGAEGVCM